MIVLDIAFVVVLILAAFRGWREGIVVQIFSIAALVLGVWLAFRFASQAGGWIGLPDTPWVAGFALILVAVIVLMWVAGRTTRGLFRLSGLKILDSIGGTVLSAAKAVLILALLTGIFATLNRSWRMVEPGLLENSYIYPRLEKISAAVFPYVTDIKDRILKKSRRPEPAADNDTHAI